MWLFWLKLISISIVVLSGAIAAFREMHPRGKRSKIPRILFYLAIIFGPIAITTQVVGHFMETESELQRKADLQYIQALDTPLLRLGLDLILHPIATNQDIELQWMFRYDKHVPTVRGSQRFYNHINLHFSPDTGWSIFHTDGHDVHLDSSENHLFLWINDFGIKKDGMMVWDPKRIADLTGLQIQMGLGPHGTLHTLPLKYQFPIKQIDIYANSFVSCNRIVVASAYRRKYSPHIDFYPRELAPFVDTRGRVFYLNPYGLRSSILESVKNRKQ